MTQRVDTLVFGGGVAGLWALHGLLGTGRDAWLVETKALGVAQSMQAQGIVHGGGKYALRKVGDIAAIQEISAMPARWRDHRAGKELPSLEGVSTSSDQCWLWLPKNSLMSRIEALTLMPMLRHGGVLTAAPRPRPREEWPAPLQAHAHRAYSMDEPVLNPVSVIKTLVAPVTDRLLKAQPIEAEDIRRGADGFEIRLREGGQEKTVIARELIACAGAGNAAILQAAGHDPALMQRRPLRMGLIRGALPALHGHCVLGGKTRLTITSVDLDDGRRVWQVGGELAEQWATDAGEGFFDALLQSLARVLPGLSLSSMELADYSAVRAEAANDRLSRPSGVQVEEVENNFVVAWPTKWAMAPLLADELVKSLGRNESAQEKADFERWPRATLGQPPWEQATWRNANSAQLA